MAMSVPVKFRGAIIALLALAGLATAATRPAEAAYLRIGVLECVVAPGIGLLIISSKALTCTFSPSSGAKDVYTGRIGKLGIDIGITGKQVIVWAVFAAQSGYVPGSLAGNYVGVSAQASVAVGVGANALVGGSNKSIALQPLSVQAQTGLNIAAGVASLTLRRR
jgi:hypothetical protein